MIRGRGVSRIVRHRDEPRQYGGPVRWAESEGDDGVWVHVEHVGPDEHDTVPPGAQCRCGWLNIGVTHRASVEDEGGPVRWWEWVAVAVTAAALLGGMAYGLVR